MTHLDVINCAFEGGGAIFLSFNIRRLLRDKSIRGVSLLPTTWWTAWGVWNVYYYHGLGQHFSFYAGIAVLLMQATWVGLAIYYAMRSRRDARAAAEVMT